MEEQQKALELESMPNKSVKEIRELLRIIKEGSLGMVDALYEYSWLLLTKFRGKTERISCTNHRTSHTRSVCTRSSGASSTEKVNV
jgi:hypothetical protein